MKRCYIALIIVVCLIVGMTSTALADEPPPEVRRVAQEEAPHWLGLVRKAPAEHFGLTDPNQVERAELGEPYEVYTIEPDRLQEYDASTVVSTMLSKANRWLFPLLIDGKAQFFYEIALFDGEWQPVSIGAAGLARDIEQIYGHVPTLLQAKGIEGKITVRFVRVYEVYDFLLMDTPAGEFIVLPEWARLWGLPQGKLIDPKAFMPRLAREVQWKIAHPDYDGGLSMDSGGETLEGYTNEAEMPAGRTLNPTMVAWGGAVLLALVMVTVAISQYRKRSASR